MSTVFASRGAVARRRDRFEDFAFASFASAGFGDLDVLDVFDELDVFVLDRPSAAAVDRASAFSVAAFSAAAFSAAAFSAAAFSAASASSAAFSAASASSAAFAAARRSTLASALAFALAARTASSALSASALSASALCASALSASAFAASAFAASAFAFAAFARLRLAFSARFASAASRSSPHWSSKERVKSSRNTSLPGLRAPPSAAASGRFGDARGSAPSPRNVSDAASPSAASGYPTSAFRRRLPPPSSRGRLDVRLSSPNRTRASPPRGRSSIEGSALPSASNTRPSPASSTIAYS